MDFPIKSYHTLCLKPCVPCIHVTNTPLIDFKDTLFYGLHFTHTFSQSKRKALYFGNFPYSYNGTHHKALDIPDCSPVSQIFKKINMLFPELQFNSVMLHMYPNGDSYIPLHCDDENMIQEGSVILSVSLGTTREFKCINIETGQKFSFQLKHGDLVLMSKRSQSAFKHGISKSDNISTSRLSFTFRRVIGPRKK